LLTEDEELVVSLHWV